MQKRQAAADELDRFYVQVPAVASFAHATQLAHSSFGAAVRLAKRWVCSHMLSDTISDEAVELLVGSLYHSPGAVLAPGAGDVAFARFLEMLIGKEWTSDLLIVDTRDNLTATDVADLRREFRQNRDAFPALTILTSDDRTKSVWTAAGPTQLVLARMVALAQVTLDKLVGHIAAGGFVSLGALEDPMQLFRPSLSDYNVLIQLRVDPEVLPRRSQGLDYDGTAGGGAGGESPPLCNCCGAVPPTSTLQPFPCPRRVLACTNAHAHAHFARRLEQQQSDENISVRC
jgi:U3 small nucleolar RNA-associated protein 22